MACNYGVVDLIQLIVNNSKSLQDESQPPWVYVINFDNVIRKLNKMIADLKKKTTFKEIFSEFPHILERESIFTKGVEAYKAVTD